MLLGREISVDHQDELFIYKYSSNCYNKLSVKGDNFQQKEDG